MNPESVKQILESLEKNGSMAIDAIAQNAYINAWGDICLLVGAAIITPPMVWLTAKMWVGFDEADYGEDGKWLVGALASSAFSLVLLVCMIAESLALPNAIATIKNPKAAAVRLLLQR